MPGVSKSAAIAKFRRCDLIQHVTAERFYAVMQQVPSCHSKMPSFDAQIFLQMAEITPGQPTGNAIF